MSLLATLLAQLRAVSWLEWLALLSGVGYALLAVRHSRWCWVSGALSSGLLAILAARQRLPMQAFMQASYVLFAVYGFWSWTKASAAVLQPPIRTLPWIWHGAVLALIVAVTMLAATWLAKYTQADWPRLDTAVMLASYFATWLTATSRLENWGYWIVIDISSVFLYGSQSLLLAAVLFAIYAVIAVLGLSSWWRRWRVQSHAQ